MIDNINILYINYGLKIIKKYQKQKIKLIVIKVLLHLPIHQVKIVLRILKVILIKIQMGIVVMIKEDNIHQNHFKNINIIINIHYLLNNNLNQINHLND